MHAGDARTITEAFCAQGNRISRSICQRGKLRLSLIYEKVDVYKRQKKYNLISLGDRVGVAVSGGVDSMVLLHVLYTCLLYTSRCV